ncbi:MAG: HDIG domain-containing protein [Bacillati bacterium ANGP1]|uniref:HDIG domain-containing protein n=1 Tax=Candidatus Segetimicrobium genomatis TaxID=2569760 RepID=A0A537J160_9BACT|nr:MAG: HDIG domain-containing protein [Terrabacteria group bacterium ANGP1]
MTRDQAWALVCEWIHNPNLRKHLLAAEAAMRAYARRFGEDEESWGIVGLVHDLDYERCPSQDAGHPFVGVEELRRRGVPEAWCRAIVSHADYSGVPRQSNMEKALYGVDELVGFVIAVALVKPSKSLAEVDMTSVKKKMKDKAFARGVNREDVIRGAEELGVPLDEHIELVINALRGVASQLGL